MMNRLGTSVASIVVLALGLVPEASAQVRSVGPGGTQTIRPIAAVVPGSVEGVVVDDLGLPVSGATVSALGATSALAITDRTGHFSLRALPPGPYLVRAHFNGYVTSRRQFVDVRPSARTVMAVSLHHDDHARMMTAGMPVGSDTQTTDDHGEVAWRLRHLTRDPLKDTTDRLALGGTDDSHSGAAAKAAGLVRASARLGTLFDDLPFTGQINLLTAGSFAGVDQLFSGDTLAHGVASLSLNGPAGGWGDWSIEGITAQGDLGSWFLSGTFKSRAPASHVYDINVSYTAQRMPGDTPAADAPHAIGDGSRALGSLYGVDRWRMSPEITLTYSARYSRYDYLVGPGLLSPHADLMLKPARTVQLHASVSRHLLAPGAEDFLPPLMPGVWVPAERSFDWLSMQPLRAERANTYELRVEHDLGKGYSVAARTFYQEVENQLAALFGPATDVSMLPDSRYHVAGIGNLEANGWSVGLSNSAYHRLHGSIAYQLTRTNWQNYPDAGLIAAAAPSLVRTPEVLHDVTTTIDAELPRSETRLLLFYKVNTGFSRPAGADAKPGIDGRFDVQVTQPLPFLDFTLAQWQIVFAVRNIFRETSGDASVYDELLVVRPPKRLVGGLIVRF